MVLVRSGILNWIELLKTIICNENLIIFRFDVVGSPLQPIIAEPIKINIPLGESVKLKTDTHERGNGNSTDRKVLSIPASDVPGWYLLHWIIHLLIRLIIDLLIHWFVDWLICWFTDWLIDWYADSLIGWLITLLIDWLTDWLCDWVIYWLIPFT